MPRLLHPLLPLLLSLAFANVAAAQVFFDGSLGPRGPAPTRSDLPGFDLDTLIRYDEREASPQGLRVGGNLFHSLSELGVPQPVGRTTSATFQAIGADGQPLVLDNVIARITGNDPSVIEGVLRSEIPGADLYLLNPRGVIFRGDASGATLESRIDVPASFFVSTADALHFEDGRAFRVADPVPEVTLSVPSYFAFLGGNDAQVALQDRAFLRPAEGSAITIVSGGLSLDGEALIDFVGGSARVAAVGSAAVEVGVDVESFDAASAAPDSLGTISLEMDSDIRPVSDDPNGPQGRVVLRGGRLVVDDSLVEGGGEQEPGRVGVLGSALDVEMADEVIARNDARLQVRSAADVGAGSGRLVTRRLEVRDDGTRVGVRTAGGATAAPFVVDADEILVTQAGQLLTENNGASVAGGLLDVRAGRLEVRDGGRVVSATVFNSTPGGEVSIAGDEIVVTRSEGAESAGVIESISVFGGPGGDLALDAAETRVEAGGEIRAFAGATANSGDVVIEGGSLDVRGGGQVRTNTSTDHAAGDVWIDVAGSVTLTGDGPDPNAPSGIFARSGSGPGQAGGGAAGDVQIHATSLAMTGDAVISTRSFGTGSAGSVGIDLEGGDLSVAGGAEISARTNDADSGGVDIHAGSVELTDGAGISSTTLGSGKAGMVHLVADEVRLRGAGTEILSQSSEALDPDAGDAGVIHIEASGSLELQDGARISVLSRGAGAAGDVVISAGQRVRLHAGEITTEATSQINESQGGSIEILAGERVELVESALRTSVRGRVGTGDAGNITIAGPDAGATSFVVLNRSQVLAQAILGDGGDIRIAANAFLESTDSVVNASSDLGIDGVIAKPAPDTTLIGGLARLPASFLDATALLRQHCAARAADSGSFVVEGRDGPGESPARPLSASMPLPTGPVEAAPDPITSATGWTGLPLPIDCEAFEAATRESSAP